MPDWSTSESYLSNIATDGVNHAYETPLMNNALENMQSGLLSWSEHLPTVLPSSQSISEALVVEGIGLNDSLAVEDVGMTDMLSSTDGSVTDITPAEGITEIICYGRVNSPVS